MSEPFIGEIRIFAGNFAPRFWSFCQGGEVQIAQNPALYSLLSTIYGGDGRVTFGLPNMMGRVVVGAGRGPGLTERKLGFTDGVPEVGLQMSQMPTHSHYFAQRQFNFEVEAATEKGVNNEPGDNDYLAASYEGDELQTDIDWYSDSDNNLVPIGGVNFTSETTVGNTGGGNPHANVQPVMGLYYIIALQGIYPSRP